MNEEKLRRRKIISTVEKQQRRLNEHSQTEGIRTDRVDDFTDRVDDFTDRVDDFTEHVTWDGVEHYGLPDHVAAGGDGSEDYVLTEHESETIVLDFLVWIYRLFGVMVMLLLAHRYSQYLKLLHENQMWFSNIQPVEREISFRTESGLYYSYYKQLLSASTLWQGILDLTQDNVTEHPNTINILERMNVYQEVVMAAVYKALPQGWIEPIYLYIDTVFYLQGLKLCALYTMTWLLSGSWLAGVLMSAFLTFNREDETRVEMTIPLRENWSLPFFWLQMAILTYYFRPTISRLKQVFCIMGLLVTTDLFCVTWQFNQFVLLLQAMALFGSQLLDVIPRYKIFSVFLVQLTAMSTTCLLQFGNKMILTSLLFSFIPAAIIVIYIKDNYLPIRGSGVFVRITKVGVHIMTVFLLMAFFNISIKIILNEEADEHIYKFILSKFGFDDPRDFDVNLYLCNGAFEYLPMSTFIRLTQKLVLPIYILVHMVLLIILVADFILKPSNGRGAFNINTLCSTKPELSYHTIQAVFYGLLAVTTLRMKYFWTPYIFVLGSVGVCDKFSWTWLLSCFKFSRTIVVEAARHIALLWILAALLYRALPPALQELEELREFYDDDTVELMNWINFSTHPKAAFTGSMQLLAGVKLCTGRHITNHPHYEDKDLRLKTKQLYQMYGHRRPEDVYRILTEYQADYIILEDSICLSSRTGCRLSDLIDLDNGVIPKDGPAYPGLVGTNIPLFCDEIRHGNPPYSKYFSQVFINRTFRIYRVLRRT